MWHVQQKPEAEPEKSMYVPEELNVSTDNLPGGTISK